MFNEHPVQTERERAFIKGCKKIHALRALQKFAQFEKFLKKGQRRTVKKTEETGSVFSDRDELTF